MADISTGQGEGTGPSFEQDARWSRVPRWLHRVAHDRVMLVAPGGDQRTLEGLAALVWVVLDVPGTANQLVVRIGGLWPDVNVGRERVLEALETLETHGVVSAR